MKALLPTLSCLLLLAAACGSAANDSTTSPSGNGAFVGGGLGPDAPGTSVNALALDDKLIVTTHVELEVAQLRNVFDTIKQTTYNLGGFVAEARISDSDEDPTAFLRLRVPVSRHDELLAAIRSAGAGGVKREDSRAVEVTAEFTDLQSQLRNLQATEAQYQQLLGRAGSIEEVLQVTSRLDAVRGDIERVQGRINLLEDQVGFATISATLSLPPVAAGGLAPPLEVIVSAFEASLAVAHATLNVVIVLLVAGLWLAPAAVGVLLLWKRFRRPIRTAWAWLN